LYLGFSEKLTKRRLWKASDQLLRFCLKFMIMKYNIILIAPKYYNYHQLIIDNLIGKGHSVDFIEDKNSGFLYTLSTKSKYLLDRYKLNYKNEVLAKLEAKSYDYMIVIGGKTLGTDFWNYVGSNFSFKKILYQWDSLKNFDYRTMIPVFDSVMTFDSVDAKSLNIKYLPLFYKEGAKAKSAEDIDLLFIGTWHSDRIDILNEIALFAKANNLRYYFKIYYPYYMYLYLVYFKKRLKPSKFFIFKTVPLKQMNHLYQRSKCIVDINHPSQTGLTMRTIETIGEGKKLITTNTYVEQEEFYDEKMIQIIGRKGIVIKDDFFKTEGQYKNIERLEISNWVEQLLK
jgi:hypothetical protein